jgi:uncharacterized membrane protein
MHINMFQVTEWAAIKFHVGVVITLIIIIIIVLVLYAAGAWFNLIYDSIWNSGDVLDSNYY